MLHRMLNTVIMLYDTCACVRSENVIFRVCINLILLVAHLITSGICVCGPRLQSIISTYSSECGQSLHVKTSLCQMLDHL